MRYQWKLLDPQPAHVDRLVRELSLSPLLAHLLVQRGQTEPEQAWAFLNPRLEDLYDPYRMADMERAVERILEALRRRERILIYGDYDVDGITSTVVLKRALEMLGARVEFHIPERLEEGYGLRREILERARDDGVHLVISADCGIRAFEVCEAARRQGLDLIVTDHHLPDLELPAAYAILNPLRRDCPYPEKNLAAAGVVFKLVQALFGRAGKKEVVRHFLKLVAVGTIGDSVPLLGENRIIVRFGLEGLADPRNLGLQALLNGAGVRGEVSGFDVGFKLAPRINAVTRMGGGPEVVELFSVGDPRLAEKIVREMNEKNLRRQLEERAVLEEVERRIQAEPEVFRRHLILVAGEGWHRGVIGIVAARLAERFYRPVVVVSQDGASGQGSGRSIPGFHLLEALEECRDWFVRFGGHAQAVGFTLAPRASSAGTLRELADRLESWARSRLSPDQLVPLLTIESYLDLERLDWPLYQDLERLAPFGKGNPLPVFASKSVNVAGGPWVLKERHLKFQVQRNGSRLEAIWWKNGSAADTIAAGSPVDIAYTLSRDSYQGEEKLLLTVQDIRRQG